jgi:hypothetical protein
MHPRVQDDPAGRPDASPVLAPFLGSAAPPDVAGVGFVGHVYEARIRARSGIGALARDAISASANGPVPSLRHGSPLPMRTRPTLSASAASFRSSVRRANGNAYPYSTVIAPAPS